MPKDGGPRVLIAAELNRRITRSSIETSARFKVYPETAGGDTVPVYWLKGKTLRVRSVTPNEIIFEMLEVVEEVVREAKEPSTETLTPEDTVNASKTK